MNVYPFHRQRRKLAPALLTLLSMVTLASAAHAHGPAAHAMPKHHMPASVAPAEQTAWGMAGNPAHAQKTIEIRMSDDMTLNPNLLELQTGETVRLVVINSGQVMHEIVIGTPKELAAHAELMKKHPGMQHDEPYMAHVEPGSRGEIVWTFNRPGEFEFACLIAGHFEAGMKGRIRVSSPNTAIPRTE